MHTISTTSDYRKEGCCRYSARLKQTLGFIECPVMDTANLKIMALETIFVLKSDATVSLNLKQWPRVDGANFYYIHRRDITE